MNFSPPNQLPWLRAVVISGDEESRDEDHRTYFSSPYPASTPAGSDCGPGGQSGRVRPSPARRIPGLLPEDHRLDHEHPDDDGHDIEDREDERIRYRCSNEQEDEHVE